MEQISTTDSAWLAIGTIVKARGLQGEIKVTLYSGDSSDIAAFSTIAVEQRGTVKQCAVLQARSQGKNAVIKLREVTSREEAELLVGAEISVLKTQMPPLADDEFYWHEMLGLTVVTDKGRVLGSVTSLIATGANDVLVVTGNDGEYLIPAIQEVIVRQDNEAGILIISPMPGLLEMNTPDAC